MCAQKAKENAFSQSEIARLMSPKDFDNFSSSSSTIMSPVSLAIYVRQLLQNWRQGTVGCKGRSDVSYANRKPWKQKGTGRARAGSARSPLWRGGGVIFGPQPRVRVLKTSKQLRSNVLNGLFDQYLKNDKVFILDWSLEKNLPKTNEAFSALVKANLYQKKSILFLQSDDIVHYASFVNIKNISVVFFDQPNAYTLSFAHNWIVLKKDLEAFKGMVQKWV